MQSSSCLVVRAKLESVLKMWLLDQKKTLYKLRSCKSHLFYLNQTVPIPMKVLCNSLLLHAHILNLSISHLTFLSNPLHSNPQIEFVSLSSHLFIS